MSSHHAKPAPSKGRLLAFFIVFAVLPLLTASLLPLAQEQTGSARLSGVRTVTVAPSKEGLGSSADRCVERAITVVAWLTLAVGTGGALIAVARSVHRDRRHVEL